MGGVRELEYVYRFQFPLAGSLCSMGVRERGETLSIPSRGITLPLGIGHKSWSNFQFPLAGSHTMKE